MTFIIKIIFYFLISITKLYDLGYFYSHQIRFDEIFKQNKNCYFVLFYLEKCLSCNGVIEYIEKNEKIHIYTIFFIDLLTLDESNRIYQNNNYNVSEYQNISINLTPTLLAICQGICINQTEGYQDIIYFLSDFS